MSITEMKVQAFEKLASLNEESAIKEILVHLETLTAPKPTFDADKFFEKSVEKYDDVLRKLAQ